MGGLGAYTSGVIRLLRTQTFYLFIGSHGAQSDNLNPYNGGGSGVNTVYSSSGGGCSDIRLKNGTDFESRKSRIIVSSGGAGGVIYEQRQANGGSGGISSGYNGSKTSGGSPDTISIPEGGQIWERW